jgi:boron transporter
METSQTTTSVLPTAQDPRSAEQSQSLPNRDQAWWNIHIFRGMINDLRRRIPFYWSDWVDAWDYRVVPATVYMYFAK